MTSDFMREVDPERQEIPTPSFEPTPRDLSQTVPAPVVPVPDSGVGNTPVGMMETLRERFPEPRKRGAEPYPQLAAAFSGRRTTPEPEFLDRGPLER